MISTYLLLNALVATVLALFRFVAWLGVVSRLPVVAFVAASVRITIGAAPALTPLASLPLGALALSWFTCLPQRDVFRRRNCQLQRSIKYIAEISPVREVTLLGTAELAFWKDRLRQERLHPANVGGRAQVLISAVDSKYMGLAFREVSVSVFVSAEPDGPAGDAVFLAQAYNSSRLLAWAERTLFHTPYYHARIELDCRLPAGFHVSQKSDLLLRAAM